METPEVLFDRWYVQPLRSLQKMPNGDGGFIALAVSCFLYERYAISVIKTEAPGEKANDGAIRKKFAADFGVDEKTAEIFWDVIRNGLLHGAMPKQQEHKEPTPAGWVFRDDFPPVELAEWNGEQVLKVQPWKIMEKVVSLWQQNMHLLDQNKSFPWANIVPLPL